MNGSSWFSFHLADFAFSFLSILFEGVPFLLLGSVLSGVIDAFISPATLMRFLPKNQSAAIVLSGLLGAVLPMCECGSVVVIRRFIRKGLPVSCAVTYMLGAPIVSPIVALSTLAAFRGQSPVVITALRIILGFCQAVLVGFIVQQLPPSKLLQSNVLESLPERRRTAFHITPEEDAAAVFSNGISAKISRAIQSSASDFLDVAFFFIVGATIAAVFNTAVNQQIIQPFATNQTVSILVMMLLAFALALCSSTDAFIAASFTAFPFAAKLAFLVFGPVFDTKLFFLYGAIFRRWFVLCLLLGLFIFVAVTCGIIGNLKL
jgi:uncharacterized membrane protein YraQ (UPF0718 family)